MGTLDVRLSLPTHIEDGLRAGLYERLGGVIVKHAQSGRPEIVCWLRDTVGVKNQINQMPGVSSPLSGLLGLANTAFSVLNLGLTIAYGEETLKRLDRVESKLDRLQQITDYNFGATLRMLSALEADRQDEKLGELRAAYASLREAQLLTIGSDVRGRKLHSVSESAQCFFQYFTSRAQRQTTVVVDRFAADQDKTGYPLTHIDEEAMLALHSIQVAAAVLAMRATVEAEISSPAVAAFAINEGVSQLETLLKAIGHACLTGQGKHSVSAYSALMLSPRMRERLPQHRVKEWIARFDPDTNGYAGVLAAFQDYLAVEAGRRSERRRDFQLMALGMMQAKKKSVALSEVMRIQNSTAYESAEWTPFPVNWDLGWLSAEHEGLLYRFFDHLDAGWEDLLRLRGYAAEYLWAADRNLNMKDYQDHMSVATDSQEPLVCLIPTKTRGVPHANSDNATQQLGRPLGQDS